MVYQGSKNRIAKDIIKIMEPYFSKDKMYYEPFVGGANMIDKIPKNKVKGLIGNDANKYLIALLKHMQTNEEIPFTFIEKEDWYKNYLYPFRKGELNIEDWKIGYLGFTKTFSGKFMDSYAGLLDTGNKQMQMHNNIIKQRKNIKDITFICGQFDALNIENNSIVYLDPPYKGTTKYSEDINHNYLLDWARMLVDVKNCIVFISEYNIEDENFKEIWRKNLNATGLGHKKQIEKLYMYKKEDI